MAAGCKSRHFQKGNADTGVAIECSNEEFCGANGCRQIMVQELQGFPCAQACVDDAWHEHALAQSEPTARSCVHDFVARSA